MKRPPLTTIAQQVLGDVIASGDAVIDATAGNGHDTLFLAERVGPQGVVFSIDLQPEAVAATRERVESAGLANVRLFTGCHSRVAARIPPEFHGRIAVAMFNLGYLPGGDKSVTTCAGTSLEALRGVARLLRPGGLLTVLAYRGHPAGAVEFAAIEEDLESADCPVRVVRSWHDDMNPERSPKLWLLEAVRGAS